MGLAAGLRMLPGAGPSFPEENVGKIPAARHA